MREANVKGGIRYGSCMQKSAMLLTCLLILCGCTHDQYSNLKKLADGLERPWPGSYPLSMTMTVRDDGGRTVLHCRLQNLSSMAIGLDRSRFPWKQPIFFLGTVVTSEGCTFAVGFLASLHILPVHLIHVYLAPTKFWNAISNRNISPRTRRPGPRRHDTRIRCSSGHTACRCTE